ncbi:MAG: hypothetical protein ACYDCQ_03280 [Dehalococcoidia bacterium]
MANVLNPIAVRLLGEIERAQQALIAHAGADDSVRRGLAAAHAAIAAALDGVAEEVLLRSPAPDQWCMAEVAEHVADHDGHLVEVDLHGVTHYVEHGLEHALQLWTLRDAMLNEPAGRDGRRSATLE